MTFPSEEKSHTIIILFRMETRVNDGHANVGPEAAERNLVITRRMYFLTT